jgi:hypothetical protein
MEGEVGGEPQTSVEVQVLATRGRGQGDRKREPSTLTAFTFSSAASRCDRRALLCRARTCQGFSRE